MFGNRKKYKMNINQASQSLQQVFASCQLPPNRIPFNKIVLRQKLNTTFYDVMMTLTACLLVLTLSAPIIFVQLVNSGTKSEKVTVEADYVRDGQLHLSLSGDGILYHEAYQELPDGTRELPTSIDKKNHVICFPYHNDVEVNIYIPSKNLGTLQLLITPVTKHQ